MAWLRPIPARLLSDSCLVRELAVDGGFGEPRAISHVRFERAQSVVANAHRSAEPAVVRWSGFSRESRQDGEERGTASVEMLVVREKDAEARDAAFACEAAVRSSGRSEWNAEGSGVRILGIDTDAPTFRERDSSGRSVWAFTARLTVAREI